MTPNASSNLLESTATIYHTIIYHIVIYHTIIIGDEGIWLLNLGLALDEPGLVVQDLPDIHAASLAPEPGDGSAALPIRETMCMSIPGPPKEPKIMAQYPKIDSMGSMGSIFCLFGGPGICVIYCMCVLYVCVYIYHTYIFA